MLVWHAHNVVVLLLLLQLRDIEFDPGENGVIATIVQILLLQRSTHVVLPLERGERWALRRLVLAMLKLLILFIILFDGLVPAEVLAVLQIRLLLVY